MLFHLHNSLVKANTKIDLLYGYFLPFKLCLFHLNILFLYILKKIWASPWGMMYCRYVSSHLYIIFHFSDDAESVMIMYLCFTDFLGFYWDWWRLATIMSEFANEVLEFFQCKDFFKKKYYIKVELKKKFITSYVVVHKT